MTRHLDAAPLLAQHAAGVDQERGAFDSPYFFAIHFLHFDDAEKGAQHFFLIGNQREGQFEFCLEIVMRAQAVARHAEDFRAGLLELRIQITELQTFGRAARRVVLRIEIQDELLAAGAREGEGGAAGRRKAEIADRLADCFQSCLGLF